MRRACIIPARGGSKRIPRKNIRLFFGQPMIAYSIQAAQRTDLFDRIIVSTDDEQIAETARSFGAETPFMRPPELSNDHVGTDAVLIHAANWLIDRNERPDALCCIYATAPFLTPERLIEGWHALQGRRFAFSVTSYAFPVQRAIYLTAEGGVAMYQPEHQATRSQDLTPAYHDAAQFYWSWTDATLSGENVMLSDSAPVVLPRTEVVDIDTPEDWAVAEQIFAATQRHQK